MQLAIKLAKLYLVSLDYLVGLTDISEPYNRQVMRSDDLVKYVKTIGRNVKYLEKRGN